MFSPINNQLAKANFLPFYLLVTALMIAFGVTLPARGQSVNATKAGKGLRFMAADSSFSTQINVRIQSLYAGEYNLDDESYEDGILIRRSRLKLEGFAFHPKWEYKLELGLSNRDHSGEVPQTSKTSNLILDALVRWNINDNWWVMMGQTKLPGNRERVISSQKLQFVDRSLLNSRYTLDRDAGIQMGYTFSVGKTVFREIASISMGEGRNITADNAGGYDYTGRIEVLPFGEFNSNGDYFGADLSREESPKLAIGLTYDYNDGATRERGQLGKFLDQGRDLKTVFADAMFKYQGFSAMAEYAHKKAARGPVVARDSTGKVTQSFFTGKGLNLQAGYLFQNNFEVAGRFTGINPDAVIQRSDNAQYTLGVSRYLMGHTLKVQSDVSMLQEDADFANLMYRFQVEIGF